MPAFTIVAAISAMSAPAAAPASPPQSAACGPAATTPTLSKTPIRPRKLGELPDGLLMRAVLLKIGPCSASIVWEPAGFGAGAWRYELNSLAAIRPAPITR